MIKALASVCKNIKPKILAAVKEKRKRYWQLCHFKSYVMQANCHKMRLIVDENDKKPDPILNIFPDKSNQAL